MQDNMKIKELLSIQLPGVSVHGGPGFQEVSSMSTNSWLRVYCLVTLTVFQSLLQLFGFCSLLPHPFSLSHFLMCCHLSSPVHSVGPEEESFFAYCSPALLNLFSNSRRHNINLYRTVSNCQRGLVKIFLGGRTC